MRTRRSISATGEPGQAVTPEWMATRESCAPSQSPRGAVQLYGFSCSRHTTGSTDNTL